MPTPYSTSPKMFKDIMFIIGTTVHQFHSTYFSVRSIIQWCSAITDHLGFFSNIYGNSRKISRGNKQLLKLRKGRHYYGLAKHVYHSENYRFNNTNHTTILGERRCSWNRAIIASQSTPVNCTVTDPGEGFRGLGPLFLPINAFEWWNMVGIPPYFWFPPPLSFENCWIRHCCISNCVIANERKGNQIIYISMKYT